MQWQKRGASGTLKDDRRSDATCRIRLVSHVLWLCFRLRLMRLSMLGFHNPRVESIRSLL
jgi:hypothetical protein